MCGKKQEQKMFTLKAIGNSEIADFSNLLCIIILLLHFFNYEIWLEIATSLLFSEVISSLSLSKNITWEIIPIDDKRIIFCVHQKYLSNLN